MAEACIESDGILDEVAIECVLAGRPVRLTSEERMEAVRRLTDKGFSAKEIAARLRVSDRQVVRYRRSISSAVT